jgi:hypothetical protein
MNDLMVVGQRWNVTLPGYFAGNLAVLNFGSLVVEKVGVLSFITKWG